MRILTLFESCIIAFWAGLLGTLLIGITALTCAKCIWRIYDKMRQDATKKRALQMLFGTVATLQESKQQKQICIEAGDSCSICLVRLFNFISFSNKSSTS